MAESLSETIARHNTEVYLNTDHFAESVILHSDTDVTIIALIDPVEELSSDDEPAEFRTQFHILDSNLEVLSGVHEATLLGFRWHILEPYPAEQGMLSVPCMRRYDSNTKSQIFDLKHNQATWHD